MLFLHGCEPILKQFMRCIRIVKYLNRSWRYQESDNEQLNDTNIRFAVPDIWTS